MVYGPACGNRRRSNPTTASLVINYSINSISISRVSNTAPTSSLSHQAGESIFHVYHGTTRSRRGHWQPLVSIKTLPMSNAHRKVLRVALELS